ERERLAVRVAMDLEIAVKLEDQTGTTLSSFGDREHCGREYRMRIPRTGDQLGSVVVCSDRYGGPTQHRPWRFLVPLTIFVCMIWAASGKIARRLARPLGEVARVAEAIGSGKLSTRAQACWRTPDEVGVLADS